MSDTVPVTHIRDLVFDPRNPRKHNPRNIGMTAESLQQFGPMRSIVIDEHNVIIAGNGVVEAAAQAGIEAVRVFDRATGEMGPAPDGPYILAVRVTGLTEDQKRQYAVADNRTAELAEWEAEVLAELYPDRQSDWFFEDELSRVFEAEADDILDGAGDVIDIEEQDEAVPDPPETRTLADRFIVPPFSVLDARQGYWQARKTAWIGLGIRSELGRGENALGRESECEEYRTASGDYSASGAVGDHGTGGMADGLIAMRKASPGGATVTQNADGSLNYQPTNNGENANGTSIFDPVLCELAYRWFCPPGGTVLDPFAGGSVRGIVAHKTGRRYVGIDLSAPQVEANYAQAKDVLGTDPHPAWHVGDSRDVRTIVGADTSVDLVFSCPPYADLEVYSDHPADLSTMPYDDFLVAYRQIIAASVGLLADNRFACFVVGDVRDRKGIYRNFVSHTIQAFEDAGARLYNEAILVTAVGSLPIRVGRQFETGRKLGKTHQNVLVFVKGDPRKATANAGPVDVADVFADGEDVA